MSPWKKRLTVAGIVLLVLVWGVWRLYHAFTLSPYYYPAMGYMKAKKEMKETRELAAEGQRYLEENSD